MFTGFASENTPAIQVWDFFTNFASSTVNRRVALSDDCAPIQIFKTGINTTSIYLYLPSAPIEGKQIKIINAMFGGFSQTITLYSSDTSGSGSSSAILVIGAGQTVDICYSKNFISFGAGGGNFSTGWITLNSAPSSSANYNAVVLGGSSNTANGPYAAALGGGSNTASGSYSAVIGGNTNTASGTYSFVTGGQSNTASGNYSAVIAGDTNNTNNGSNAVIVGGSSNSSGGVYGFIGGGFSNTASSSYTAVVGGISNTANSDSAIVLGGRRGTTRSINGNFVASASVTPIQALSGVQQTALLVLGRQTTDATATVLASDANSLGTTNQVILPNNSAYYFRGECIAGKTAAGDTKGWYIEGVIKRGAGVGTTAIVGTATVTSLYADAGAATWAVTATADVTNGGLAITVTGQAATTIRWVCQIRTTEMTF